MNRAMRLVAEGGGIWVGMQDGGALPFVLFNSPTTGSTLALTTAEITAEKVRAKIEASDRNFAKGRKQT